MSGGQIGSDLLSWTELAGARRGDILAGWGPGCRRQDALRGAGITRCPGRTGRAGCRPELPLGWALCATMQRAAAGLRNGRDARARACLTSSQPPRPNPPPLAGHRKAAQPAHPCAGGRPQSAARNSGACGGRRRRRRHTVRAAAGRRRQPGGDGAGTGEDEGWVGKWGAGSFVAQKGRWQLLACCAPGHLPTLPACLRALQAVRPAVQELARLEFEAQSSFFMLKRKWAAVA